MPKVKEIQKSNERKGHDKWFITCMMDNGDLISVMRNTQDGIKEGDTLEYELGDADEYGVHRIKEAYKKTNKGFAPKNYKMDSITMCMSYAKDLVVGGKIELKQLIPTADKIYDRVLTKINAGEPVQKLTPAEAQDKFDKGLTKTPSRVVEDDDLPF